MKKDSRIVNEDMSEIGTLLENQRDAQGLSAKEMAAKIGIAQSALSHLTTDARRGVRPPALMKIASGISDDPYVQADLLAAFFRDQCTARYKPWIKVSPDFSQEETSTASIREDAAPVDPIAEHAATLRQLKLANGVIRALTAIARGIPGHPKFRTVIEDLAAFAAEDLPASS